MIFNGLAWSDLCIPCIRCIPDSPCPRVIISYSLNASAVDVNCPAETDSANRAKSR